MPDTSAAHAAATLPASSQAVGRVMLRAHAAAHAAYERTAKDTLHASLIREALESGFLTPLDTALLVIAL